MAAAERSDMVTSNGMPGVELERLRALLPSVSVISPTFVREHGLKAALVDDNFLYEEEGQQLMSALAQQGATSFNWCKTSDVVGSDRSLAVHSIECNYDEFESRYLRLDDEIQYWDRLIYLDDLGTMLLHTAHDHLIYVGSEDFLNTATGRRNQFRDGWLATRGTAFTDPALVEAYDL